MIYLHKIFPLIFSPVIIIISLILFGLVLKKYFLIYLATGLLFIASLPIVSTCLVKYLERGQIYLSLEEVKPANAIIVLGGMLTSVQTSRGIEFEWLDPDRFFGGVELALANKAHYLIFTGGKLPWEKGLTTEGVYLKQKTVMYGIAKDRVFVTKPASNTEEEANAVKELLDQELDNGIKSVILVTSAFHMPRAKSLFEKVGFNVKSYPVDFKTDVSNITPMSFIPSAHALKDMEFSLRELMGRLYYSFSSMKKPRAPK